jgi:hypothetical protein
MIVDVNNFYRVFINKNEDGTIFTINPETENPKVFRFEYFYMQASMKDVCFQPFLLFLVLSHEPAFR